MHDLPIATFRYYVDLDRHLSETQEGILTDQAPIARLLEETHHPLRRHELADALNDLGREPVDDEVDLLERRLDCALRYLQTNEWVRAVRRGKDVGWVWNGLNISDHEWRERLRDPDSVTPPIAVVRIKPPEGFVVVVEPHYTGLTLDG